MTPKLFNRFKDSIYRKMQTYKIETEGQHSFEFDFGSAVGQVEFMANIRTTFYGDGFSEQRTADDDIEVFDIEVRLLNQEGEVYIPSNQLMLLEQEVKLNV